MRNSTELHTSFANRNHDYFATNKDCCDCHTAYGGNGGVNSSYNNSSIVTLTKTRKICLCCLLDWFTCPQFTVGTVAFFLLFHSSSFTFYYSLASHFNTFSFLDLKLTLKVTAARSQRARFLRQRTASYMSRNGVLGASLVL